MLSTLCVLVPLPRKEMFRQEQGGAGTGRMSCVKETQQSRAAQPREEVAYRWIGCADPARWLRHTAGISSIRRMDTAQGCCGFGARPAGVTVTLGEGNLICYLACSCCIVPAAGPLLFIGLVRKLRSLIPLGWLDIKYFITKLGYLSYGRENSGCNLWRENSSIT